MNTGQTVLALDDLLCNATPEQAAAIRDLTPTWLTDQTQAASDHVQNAMRHAAEIGEVQRHIVAKASDHPDWVRLPLLDTVVRWLTGKASTCMHAPNPMRPQPVFAAAWKPGLVVCGMCNHLLRAPSNEADRTCDGCGRITEGPDRGDPMWPFWVSAGALSYTVGTCNGCRYWETS